jgi:PAS domain S-box-containing protein
VGRTRRSDAPPWPRPKLRTPDRSQLQQIIAGVTEGVILVEPDRRIVWANEAALQMHGATSVGELGATVEDYAQLFALRYRNGQALEPEEHHLARLCQGESFDGLILEVRRTDDPEADWVHRARGFVLNDAHGEPDVLVLVLNDATDAFEAEERFERMFNANPAPALIVRVSDLRYVRVNQGFLEMTGHGADEIVGRSIYEFDVLSGVEEREIAAARVTDWQTVPQMEAELPLPGGGTKLVIVAGHPIEIADAQCMLFTFADLEPRRRAERALNQSEERFAKAFRLAPVPMSIASLDGFRMLNVNHAFLKLTGWTLEEVVGRAPADIELWDSSETRKEVERRLVQTGGFRDVELKLKTKSGSLVEVSASAETVTIGGEPSILSVLQDISERRRSEADLAEAIEAAMRDDGAWLSRKVMDKLAAKRSGRADEALPDSAALTLREQEVLGLICQGRSDGEIAEALKLTRNTVRNHVARVYAKTGVHSRSEAVVWARDRVYNSKALRP